MDTTSSTSFRLSRLNLYLIAAGVAVILLGLVLMMVGPVSGEGTFEPEIFSFRRIVVAPMVIFAGFLSIVVSIFWRFRSSGSNDALSANQPKPKA